MATSGAFAANPPATPPPDTRPAPGPLGASGNDRWQFASPTGLYVVDPAAGELAIQGAIPGSVPLVTVTADKTAPPADTVVTLNGVNLIRWSGNPLTEWTVDPHNPPPVGSGGFIELVASDGTGRQRQMVLQCPADVPMGSVPAVASSVAGRSSVSISFARSLVVNIPTPAPMASIAAVSAWLMGYDPATNTIMQKFGGHALIGAGLAVAVPITAATTTSQYLMDIRWAGPWAQDGETGAFCGLAKRWTYAAANSATPGPTRSRAVRH